MPTSEPPSLFGADETVRRISLVRLSSEIGRALATVGRIVVEGEVHRPNRGSTGAIYFSLRDRAVQVSVRCPAARAGRARVVEGERVAVVGRLDYGPDRGQLQLLADEVTPVGAGAVAAAIAEARRRLDADGLLLRPRRPLPTLPRLVGVVCGTDAAVRKDIESVIADRFPGYPVRFLETLVSGPGAAESVMRAMATLAREPFVDVVILARGGGDATQLLPFSDEELCRAICACPVPVVSAIGHEGDRPLSDEVADRRSGTPSLAAAAVIPPRVALVEGLDRLLACAAVAIDGRLDRATRDLAAVDRDRAVAAALGVAEDRLLRATHRLALVHPASRIDTASARLAGLEAWVDGLSPARVMARGYAVVRRAGGGPVVRDSAEVVDGDAVEIDLARGRLTAVVSGRVVVGQR